jgi:TfoX/Sxy family transcriptional regulator of competence genes
MAYDEGVAQRIREYLGARDDVVEKKMFGGLAFMVAGNMCCGVIDDRLMIRVGPDEYEQARAQPHVHEMDFTGKPLRGFVYVEPDGFANDGDLFAWIERCLSFVSNLPPK